MDAQLAYTGSASMHAACAYDNKEGRDKYSAVPTVKTCTDEACSSKGSMDTGSDLKEAAQDEDSKALAANCLTHRPGITHDQMVQAYNEWASKETYEHDLSPLRYRGPQIAATTVARYIPVSKRESTRVLDIAAGTGFVGEQLKSHGFKLIDGLEPAAAMLEIARAKGTYTNYINEPLGRGNSSILNDAYDVVVTSGGMGEGHIPCRGVLEMVRVTKPGGYVVIVMREKYLHHVTEYVDRLEPLLHHLNKESVWRLRERTLVAGYSFTNDGLIIVANVCVRGAVPSERVPEWL